MISGDKCPDQDSNWFGVTDCFIDNTSSTNIFKRKSGTNTLFS